MPDTTRILCVCLGNICRSPTAEVVLRHHLPHAQVDSAGTGDWHIGGRPYAPACSVAQARGYDMTGLQARQVTDADFDRFDLNLAMDQQNQADLKRWSSFREDRVRLFLDPVGGGDVPDPYYSRDFNGVFDLIERTAKVWARLLA